MVRPAGYAALVDRYGLQIMPNWHRSSVGATSGHRVVSSGGVVDETYPLRYWPGDSVGDHLEFALKYDGTNLEILAAVFRAVPAGDVASYVGSRPTGKYARRIWFFYELLTEARLPLADLEQGNYIDALDPHAYYTVEPAVRKVRRQRIRDNLPGDHRFCPLVRRTEALVLYEKVDLAARSREIIADYAPALLRRALNYLYTKETRSSFEIERVQPGANRIDRFVELLELAEREDFCDEPHLVDLQRRIVDPRFATDGYRTDQNYVGETVAWQRERVHFVSPRPEDLPGLMAGLIDAHRRMERGGVSPVVHAAAIAYAFVFLHPFDDGNGRIHRFLVHNILARQGFTPEGLMFPVSAVMLQEPGRYDASLEAFSRPLMPLVEYSLDEEGRMTVHNETALRYRYIDLTSQAEALFGFIERTIETELVRELDFLVNYDVTKAAIQEIVDMPDRRIDLFIRFCLQNQGCLSGRKRRSHFEALTDDEIDRMEAVVQEAYGDVGESQEGPGSP